MLSGIAGGGDVGTVRPTRKPVAGLIVPKFARKTNTITTVSRCATTVELVVHVVGTKVLKSQYKVYVFDSATTSHLTVQKLFFSPALGTCFITLPLTLPLIHLLLTASDKLISF